MTRNSFDRSLTLIIREHIFNSKCWHQFCFKYNWTYGVVMKHVKLNTILTLVTVALALPLVSHAQINGSITKVGDATHVEFTGVKNWDYELVKISDKKLRLLVPQISNSTAVNLKKWNEDLIDKIEINKNSVDNKTELLITLKHSYVESFDYQVDEPSKLIVDFYIDNEKFAEYQKEQKQLQAQKKKQKKPKAKKKVVSNDKTYKKMDRSPSSEFLSVENSNSQSQKQSRKSGVYDAADPRFDRFRIKKYEIDKKALIASREEVYIRFPILKLKTSYLDEIREWKPEYVISKNDTKESKRAQLLQTLYKKKRYASFLKTYDFFVNQYPESKYMQVIDHMYADIHYKMWEDNQKQLHYDEAVKKYQQLIVDYPNSPLNERTQLLLNFTELERGNSLYTIQKFEEFVKKYPQSEYIDKAKFAIAESYIQLKKYDQANSIYKNMIKNSKNKNTIIEATYRLGDIAFYKKDYKDATEKYVQALKAYPKAESEYENLNYNLAESLFWQGKYPQALNRHIRNLQLFPDHNYNAYSLTRIGEILNALGADKEQVIAAYLESYFRYDKHPGAKVARVRMLKEQMRKMKDKQLEKSLEELNKIAKDNDLPKQDEFVNLMIAGGLKNRKEYSKAAQYLIDYYQKHPTKSNLDFFKKKIVSNIADEMNENYKNKNFMDNLALNGKYKSTWLKDNNRIDTKYFLAKAFEVAGVYDEAEKIYNTLLEKRKSIVGTDNELERSVYENLPSVDAIKLGMANTNYHNRNYSDSYKFLNSINPNKLTKSENIERLNLLSNVLQEQGQNKLALEKVNALVELWADQEELQAQALLTKSRLENSLKKYQTAEKTAKKALSIKPIQKNKTLVSKLSRQLADSLYSQNKKMSAVESYLKVLKENPDDVALRYRVGNILFENNDINGAEQMWSKIPPENSMYKKMANEKLNTMKWEKNYKKYIERIPAMNKGSVE